jgi:SAM-dependent methyltransferase
MPKNTIPENTSKNTHDVVAHLLLEEDIGDRILDIPSGAGAFTKRMMDLNKDVYPADIENILEVENSNFCTANMNDHLPYEDSFFDAVICIDGIEHLERPFDFIQECYRVLKPAGILIISTPNINSIRSRWRWFWTSHHNKCKSPLNEYDPGPLHHINMMSYQRLRYILHTRGFAIKVIATNRIKWISCIYILFVPFSFLFTKFVYNKEEKDLRQRKANQDILKDLFKRPLLFGETMIIKARK